MRSLSVSLLVLILAGGTAAAAPPQIQEAWSRPSWLLDQGDFDDDPAIELLAYSNASGEIEFLDGNTGAVEGTLFPPFSLPANFSSWVADFDDDGRDELLVQQEPSPGAVFTALYDWTPGSGYNDVFDHQDDFASLDWGALRSTSLDLVENYINDLWIRDFFGAVVFQASSDIPGWGSAGFIESIQISDIDADGLDEILVTQSQSGLRTLRKVEYSGSLLGVEDGGGFRSRVLRQSFPNPAAGPTTISFDLPREGRARVRIFDARGRRVRELLDDDLQAGNHAIVWDGRDEAGRPVGPGAYFYRLEAPGVQSTRKAIRMQ